MNCFNPCCAEFNLINIKFYLYHLWTPSLHRMLKSFLMEDIQNNESTTHLSWIFNTIGADGLVPGGARSQVINSHGNDLVILEYSSFSITRVNVTWNQNMFSPNMLASGTQQTSIFPLNESEGIVVLIDFFPMKVLIKFKINVVKIQIQLENVFQYISMAQHKTAVLSNSIANTLGLMQSCTRPLICQACLKQPSWPCL